jgi:hypothetical protein
MEAKDAEHNRTVTKLKERLAELEHNVGISNTDSAEMEGESKHLKRKWGCVEDYESDEEDMQGMSPQARHARHG